MTLPAPEERYERLRQLLVEAREEAGLTQVELAAKLDRPHSFVWKIEHGVRRVDVVEFLEIAKTIGSNPITLLRKLGW
jgi:ribosome-binding protein aMBF1 (putative translation factor)